MIDFENVNMLKCKKWVQAICLEMFLEDKHHFYIVALRYVTICTIILYMSGYSAKIVGGCDSTYSVHSTPLKK